MAALSLDLTVSLRGFELTLALEVAPGETLALVGPSGAGKTTILRAVAGLVRPERGQISLGGEKLFDRIARIDLPPERRRVGYVFQEYALFPHMTVEENIRFAGRERARELMQRVGIAHLAHARPNALSGGERQRTGLARALARDPGVLLLDEPMSALDAHTRNQVRGELRAILRELQLPTLLVTHDFEDAAALADRVGVLVAGRIRQLGTPGELLGAPADAFIASFVGSNLLAGTARRGAPGAATAVLLDGGETVFSSDELDGRVGVVVHPWDISLARTTTEDSALNHLTATIGSIVPIGSRARVSIGPIVAEVTNESLARLGLEPGMRTVASFKATATRLVPLDGTGGATN